MMTKYKVDTKALKIAMIEAGYNSYTSLVKETGFSDRTISSVFNGSSNPTYPVMCKLVSALNLKPKRAGAIFLMITYVLRKLMRNNLLDNRIKAIKSRLER